MTTTKTKVKHYDHACTNCFTDNGPCQGECAIGAEAGDKLTGLIASVAKLLDSAMALPEGANREKAARKLADDLIAEAVKFAPETAEVFDIDAIDALDIPDDIATTVIARETSFEAENDCGDACKI